MSIKRVALIYDDQTRPETTGGYCLRALKQLVEVRHFRPAEFETIPPQQFDLYLSIDDGLRCQLPDSLRPAAWWMIDTHMDAEWYRNKARDFDFVFAAQLEATLTSRTGHIENSRWLPLACDPTIHRKHEMPRIYDVCFVGNMLPGIRSELLKLISRRFPRSFIGQCYFEEMAQVYSSSRLVFNRSVKDDLNMRVFEALACGSMLLTNVLSNSGQEQLFQYGVHMDVYTCADDLFDKIEFYLTRDELRERIGAAGRQEAITKHTYRQRMEELLRTVEQASIKRHIPIDSWPVARTYSDGVYFDMARPDVLALVPENARRVLDVGCGAGNLGACLKARQSTEVVGIEVVPEAARISRSRLDQVIVGDIESPSIDFPPGSFDCIICADVLEHLRDPARVLHRLRSWLQGGPLIASLPNVQYHRVATSLLDGNWTYEAAGVLDATHLRFFTRREIEKLFFRAGFQIDSIQPAPNIELQQWQQQQCPLDIKIGGLHITGLTAEQAQDFRVIQYLVVAVGKPAPEFGLTSIVIPTHNEIAYTRQCLESIRFRTDEPYEIIVVDNGSSDGTVDYLRSRPDVFLIENSDNRGFPAACNQGIGASRGDQILLLNNDVIVTTGWLRRLLRAMHRHPHHGIVGPCSNNVSGIQQIPVSYRNLCDLDGFAWDHGKTHDGKCMATDRIVGCCMLIRRSVVERIGLLDEQFGLGNFEDDDYSLRAVRAGYRLVVAWDAFVHHFGSRTFQAKGIDLSETLARNERLFRSKWQIAERQPTSEPKAAALLLRQHSGVEKREEGCLPLTRSQVTLSLCMIVRDNAKTIEACLNSIRPWVDEIIVVDTGSCDATPELVRQCGGTVYEFPWCDDFSAARNESIRHARGDWIFWMDSDDTIDAACGRKLRALADQSVEPTVMAYVMQVHCPGADEGGLTVVDHVKMFRNRPDLRFDGRIHEQILSAVRRTGGELRWTDIFVRHSGSDTTPEGRKRKHARDLRLLQLELQERPDHPFTLFNLGMTYADMRDFERAVDFLSRSVLVSPANDSHVRKAYALLVSALGELGRFASAWECCDKGLTVCPKDAELLFRRGILAYRLGRLDLAERAYIEALSNDGQKHFSSLDPGIHGFKARHNLAIVYMEMGRLADAETQWRRVLQDAADFSPGWRGLGDVLLRLGKHGIAATEAERLISHPRLRVEGLLIHAKIAKAEGRLSECLKVLEIATNEFPADLEPLQLLCQFLFEHAEPGQTEKALRLLTERDPNDAAAQHNLGMILMQLNRFGEAVNAFEASVKLRPDSPATHTNLGCALKSFGKQKEAEAAFAEAKRLTTRPLWEEATVPATVENTLNKT